MLSASRSEDLESLHVDDFRIVRIGLPVALAPHRDRESHTDCGFEEVAPSLPTPPSLPTLPSPQVVDSSPEEVSVKIVGTSRIVPAGVSGTAPVGLELEASTLEDYKQVHELFTEMLLPTDTTKLLAVLCKEMRKAAMETVIQISQYFCSFIQFKYVLTKPC